MARWHVAPALATLIRQVDAFAPRRSKRSDGTIGDAAHRARVSHHNPDADGSVNAADFTHDPAGGFDCHRFAAELVASGDDRIDHVIWNRRIWSWAQRRAGWRHYTGSNPHTAHCHVAVSRAPVLERDTRPWRLPMFGAAQPQPARPPITAPMEDDMYVRNQQTGEIFAMSATHYRYLGPVEWKARVEQEGARYRDVHPWVLAGMAASRKPA